MNWFILHFHLKLFRLFEHLTEEMKAIVDKHRFSQFEEKNSQGVETQGAKNKTDP